MRVLTLDLGTGALKVCFWEEGRLCAFEQAAIQTHYATGGIAEQDAQTWWQLAATLIQRLQQREPQYKPTRCYWHHRTNALSGSCG